MNDRHRQADSPKGCKTHLRQRPNGQASLTRRKRRRISEVQGRKQFKHFSEILGAKYGESSVTDE